MMIQVMTCPICKKPVTPEPVSSDEKSQANLLPFCSKRCQQIDFFRWSDGHYSIEEPLEDRPDLLSDLADLDEDFEG